MKQALFFSFMLLTFVGCGNSNHSGSKHEQQADTVIAQTPKFTRPQTPALMTDPNLRLEYEIKHYWDHFVFTDTTYIPTPDITEQAWVNYIDLLFRTPLNIGHQEMKNMMLKCTQNKKLFLYFTQMAEKYLYEPNSPARSEELYIPVLEVMTQTPVLDDTEKIRPQTLLEWAYKNRMGTPATDFQYTEITGKTGRLYQMSADFVLLFFNNPECSSCRDHIESMRNSPVINKLLSESRLKILSIYPDQLVDEEWKPNYALYPATWIKGYDLTVGTKYDLKASPTLYLLDKNKVVFLKDASLGLIEQFLAAQKM